MTLREAITVLNTIGCGYTDRWKETETGEVEAEGMRLSGAQAIAEAEYWGPLMLKNRAAVQEPPKPAREMTADERIAVAAIFLRGMIDDCPNCRGTNRIGVMCVGGTRIEKCHVCAPLRGVLEVLTQKGPESG
jgi:hypothetical protein